MPADARLVSGAIREGWGLEHEFLATAVEVMDGHRLDFQHANTEKKHQSRLRSEPIRFPRPYDPPKQDRRVATAAELIAFARR